MKSNPLIVCLAVLIVGLFILPMGPVASSNQGDSMDDRQVALVQDQSRQQFQDICLVFVEIITFGFLHLPEAFEKFFNIH